MQIMSGVRNPLLIPVGVHRTRLSSRRTEWFPSLPAQKPLIQMFLPMSHISCLILKMFGAIESFPLFHVDVVDDRSTVRIDRDFPGAERLGRLAPFGKRDQVADA